MKRQKTDYIVICSSCTDPSEDIGFKELDRRDRQKGWFKCLHHFVIRRDGTIEKGARHYEEPAMGLKDYNASSVSVCLIGGKGTPPLFTNAQYMALKELIDEIEDEYPGVVTLNHFNLDDQVICPGCDVLPNLKELQGVNP